MKISSYEYLPESGKLSVKNYKRKNGSIQLRFSFFVLGP